MKKTKKPLAILLSLVFIFSALFCCSPSAFALKTDSDFPDAIPRQDLLISCNPSRYLFTQDLSKPVATISGSEITVSSKGYTTTAIAYIQTNDSLFKVSLMSNSGGAYDYLLDTESVDVKAITVIAKNVRGVTKETANFITSTTHTVSAIQLFDVEINIFEDLLYGNELTLKNKPKITANKNAQYFDCWYSSNEEVATIDFSDGEITLTGKTGTTTITYCILDEANNELEVSCTLTVKLEWWQKVILFFVDLLTYLGLL